MNKYATLLFLVLGLLVFFTKESNSPLAQTTPESNQVFCANYEDLIKLFKKKYNEQSIARGLVSNGTILEILSSNDGKTFTIVSITPDRKACAVGSGENWRNLKWILNDPQV